MSFTKQHKVNFKELLNQWTLKSPLANHYTIHFKDKQKALELEEYLLGLNFTGKPRSQSDDKNIFVDWNNTRRKTFSIIIFPKLNSFMRTKRVTKNSRGYYNVLSGDSVEKFCFKFVMVEKAIEYL